jgi:hypothetical protein
MFGGGGVCQIRFRASPSQCAKPLSIKALVRAFESRLVRCHPWLFDGLTDRLKTALTDKQAKALQAGNKPVFDGKVTGLLLVPGNARKEHQPGMPWRDVPAFVKTHVAGFERGDSTRAALLFLIPTAAHSGEV